MKKINLAITGCMGRMGAQLIKSVKKDQNFKITALTENKRINKKIIKMILYINFLEIFIRMEKKLKMIFMEMRL